MEEIFILEAKAGTSYACLFSSFCMRKRAVCIANEVIWCLSCGNALLCIKL